MLYEVITLVLLLGSGVTAGFSELLALASAVAWAAGVVITKRLQTRHRVDTLALSAWQSALGGAGLVLLALLFPSQETRWTPNLIFALVYNAVLVSAICWVLWFWVLARLDAGLASFVRSRRAAFFRPERTRGPGRRFLRGRGRGRDRDSYNFV